MVEDMGDFGTGTTPPPPPGEQPAQPKSRSRARGAAAGVGVALVVGAGGIAVATSGSPSTTATPGATPTEGAPTPAPGHIPGGPGRMGGFGGGLAGIGGAGPVLHGTFVEAKTGGGYQTVQVQTGTVDSVSSTSLAVTSKDGFTFTYVVKAGAVVDAQRDGITSIKKGDEVVVNATLSGSTGTVDRVIDTTELKKSLPTLPEGGFGRGPGGGHGGRAAQTAPANPGTGT